MSREPGPRGLESARPVPERLARRLTAQLLSGSPARDPLSVAQRLLAIQGQDPRGARLAIRARSAGLGAADIDDALSRDRSLLITWLNRGTLHLVAAEDYPLLHALTTPPLLTSSRTRLAQCGVTPDQAQRGVTLIERALAQDGPQTGPALRERLERAGVSVAGQAFIHLIYRASLDGVLVRGPMLGREHAYALVRDWLGPVPAVARAPGLAELARRYLAGHGPATDRDLARWAGLPLRDARAGLESIAGSLRRRTDGLLDLAGRVRAAGPPAPRLLGAFEPLLLGWTSRRDVLGQAEPAVVSGGIFRAFALAGGRAVAVWTLSSGRVQITELEPLATELRTALNHDAEALVKFLGRG